MRHDRRHVYRSLEIAFTASPVWHHGCISDGAICRYECFGGESDLEAECPFAEAEEVVFGGEGWCVVYCGGYGCCYWDGCCDGCDCCDYG